VKWQTDCGRVIFSGGNVVDGGGSGSGVDGVEDVERDFDEGSGRVDIVVFRDPRENRGTR